MTIEDVTKIGMTNELPFNIVINGEDEISIKDKEE